VIYFGASNDITNTASDSLESDNIFKISRPFIYRYKCLKCILYKVAKYFKYMSVLTFFLYIYGLDFVQYLVADNLIIMI